MIWKNRGKKRGGGGRYRVKQSVYEPVLYYFQVFDGGDKGYITQKELHDILNRTFAMTEVDVHTLFSKVDQDKDGKITYGNNNIHIASHVFSLRFSRICL